MSVNIQTIKDIRSYLTKELKNIYHEQELTALINIIIKTLLDTTKLHQIYDADYAIQYSQAERIIEICQELKSGKPVQYILGETMFYDCVIKVTPATLIPRPETEELVQLVLKENDGYKGNIIDFGTGSGCIAIALAANLPDSKITGIEISDEALNVAIKNAHLNNVTASFLKRDILNFDISSIPESGIIVSNPPYVRVSEKNLMNRNVLDFEPYQALFVNDDDPLIFYRAIISIAEKILLPEGNLYFEINEALGASMLNLMSESGFSNIAIFKDINGKERIIRGTKNG